MRILALPLAALALIGADDPSAAEAEAPATAEASPDREACRDRIEHARRASGQPPLLRRGPATPDDPVLIYAVDRRQDGCAVMVVKGDPQDIRPLPEAPREGKLLWRAQPSR
ncbi:hypothetical protein Ga0102493_112556 [Erythrobacter litoralis]|uniref:Uncharacterized protein n=1 Tax=Erythrobacter litoralis TaxID=39960 RepID=A0A074MZX4_9SPHN|nr:hypothetical protein [Erythrobacter litoralis]AOL23568.1 hypothetical protein Ga0102493_112556 [Erythrobacter litoralis]KEO98949.1 hypothetical protein EH32_07540 [Erythrobacter litoralis]